MKKYQSLQEYYAYLFEEADAAYWLNRKVTVEEVFLMWTEKTRKVFDKTDLNIIRRRSGYDGRLVVSAVHKDRYFWVRMLLAFFNYGKRLNAEERKVYFEEAKAAWELFAKRRKNMISFKSEIGYVF